MDRIMKAKKVLVLCLCSLLFTSCSFNFSVEDLCVPPKLDLQQSQIYEALTSTNKKDITLKYPKSGDYRSAFVVQNIDDDAEDEAIVFYETKDANKNSMLRLNFLDKKGKKWVSVYDLPAAGTDVEEVIFTKISDNEETSIIITYTLQSQQEKAISILQYKNGIPTEVYVGNYSAMKLIDIDYDGRNELFLISKADVPMAYVYGIEDGLFKCFSKAELDSSAASYISITFGNWNFTSSAIFIEYKINDDLSSTDVLYTNGKTISKSSINPLVFIRQKSPFLGEIISKDMNNDGLIEVPVTVPFPTYENMEPSKALYAVVWYNIESGNIATKKYFTYVSFNNDYTFIFPKRWEGLVTVITQQGLNEVGFYDIKNLEKPLLIIKTVEKEALGNTFSDKHDTTNWQLFEGTDKNYYFIPGDSANPLTLTVDECKDSFIY